MTNNALGRFAPDLEDRCVTKADTFFTRMAAASIASQGASLGWLKVKLVAAAVESAMIERVLRHLGLLWQACAPGICAFVPHGLVKCTGLRLPAPPCGRCRPVIPGTEGNEATAAAAAGWTAIAANPQCRR